MKIYTRTGDDGSTSLYSGKRVSKDDIRVESYGTVDELNAYIGLIIEHFPTEDHHEIFNKIQNYLFTIGGILANDKQDDFSAISDKDIKLFEEEMDRLSADLSPLKHFVLPGGNQAIAHTHVARTICRRAERRVVSLDTINEIDYTVVIKYLNRLSDYLFILTRHLSHSMNVEERKWIP